MTPPADPSGPVPHRHAHAHAELVAALRAALVEAVAVEPLAVDGPTAARLLSISTKTLAGLPAAQTGRLKIGRRTLYELATLRAYVRSLVAAEMT